MLENNYADSDGASIEKCKPDYEKQILNLRIRLTKNHNFQEAIFNYVGNIRLRDKMAELVGELVSESRQIESNIEQIMKAQEKE